MLLLQVVTEQGQQKQYVMQAIPSAQRGIADPQLFSPWRMPQRKGRGSRDGHQPFPASQWNMPPWMMAWNPLMAMQQNMLPRQTQANQMPGSEEYHTPVGAKRDNPIKGKGPIKKARFYEPGETATYDEDSGNEDLAEPFDPTAHYSRATQQLPEVIRRCLCDVNASQQQQGSQWQGRTPPQTARPSNMSSLTMWSQISWACNDFAHKADSKLKWIQSAIAAALTPDLEEQGLTGDHSGGINPRKLHYWLELKAVFLAVQSFAKNLHHSHIPLLVGKTTVISNWCLDRMLVARLEDHSQWICSHLWEMLSYRFSSAGSKIHKQQQWIPWPSHGDTTGHTLSPLCNAGEGITKDQTGGIPWAVIAASFWPAQP